jgi:hypothetical protein
VVVVVVVVVGVDGDGDGDGDGDVERRRHRQTASENGERGQHVVNALVCERIRLVCERT